MKRKGSPVDGGAGSSATAAPSAGTRPGSPIASYIRTFAFLDCGVCYLPLKPPIFQCEEGHHLVCSPCRDKLAATGGKCHESSAGDLSRCHSMEPVVENVLVACPNTAYGCTATPAYCYKQDHILQECLHGPCCHCPGEACGFAVSTAALLDHIKAAHGWHCLTEVDGHGDWTVRLHDGFNFLVAACLTTTGNEVSQQQGAAPAATVVQCLLLLNVVRQPFERTIEVVWIHVHPPHAGATLMMQDKVECSILYCYPSSRIGYFKIDSHDVSKLGFTVSVPCADNGWRNPDPEGYLCFSLRNCVLAADHDRDGIQVQVTARRIIVRGGVRI